MLTLIAAWALSVDRGGMDHPIAHGLSLTECSLRAERIKYQWRHVYCVPEASSRSEKRHAHLDS